MSESEPNTTDQTDVAFRDYPDKPTSEMTHEERLAFLRHVERLGIRSSEHARAIREKLEAEGPPQEASE